MKKTLNSIEDDWQAKYDVCYLIIHIYLSIILFLKN